ncbi:MAG: zinc-ribbon domain-containing protein, partial [Chloroflexota bacterium]|nr:zinc-ribbon domain-containing protein [Chloroflexota bacterium]
MEPAATVAEENAGEVGDETEAAATATAYAPTEVTCSNCGAKVLNNAKFCTECGTPVAQA